MPSDYAKTLGARLRAIRTQQGLSLHGVEEKSRGRWKAVVVGSYERGDRAVTVQRLAELAEFYGVPVGELLPDAAPSGASALRRRKARSRAWPISSSSPERSSVDGARCSRGTAVWTIASRNGCSPVSTS